MQGPPSSSSTLSVEEMSVHIERVRPRIILALRARLSQRLQSVIDSEDLWQETVLESMRARESFQWKGEAAFLRWIMTIAVRSLTQASRRLLGRGPDRPQPVPLESLAKVIARTSTGPATWAQRRDDASRILQALEALPDSQREVLTLDLVHLMTHREMAEHLEKNLDAVRKAHLRALHALRVLLGENPEDRHG